jgi:hypothetical protein
MFCDVHADPNPTDGTAYAVVTNDEDLIFFRTQHKERRPEGRLSLCMDPQGLVHTPF